MALKNFDALIMSKGKPAPADATGANVTQSDLIFNMLQGFQGTATLKEKKEMYKLGNKIADGGDVDIDTDEIALIKKVIEPLPPISLGQICDSLERTLPSPPPEKKE